jgi:hypothetical protein
MVLVQVDSVGMGENNGGVLIISCIVYGRWILDMCFACLAA